ncbi:MAG TPA: Yip1 family protein, partial [Ignavibacteriaceae bacterium]|nr:Yip1 family protein [Ignavibacteriaceae bacterium]
IGLGSSYLGNLKEHRNFINELEGSIPKDKSLLSYASFSVKPEKINNLDLYGIEIIGNSFNKDSSWSNSLNNELGKGKVFISSVTYFTSSGNSNGYSNENTYEAQAKYFEDFLIAFPELKTSGYFINTMFNYRGDYSSLISGFSESKVYNFGLISEDRGTVFLSHKVIKSKLLNSERVTIPIGTKSDSSPMAFIVVGIALALIIGILVNSGRKFREDASRALLRPYNFFADVRDQRIISSYHSTIMAIVLAVVMGLILSSLLFYLKDNIVFEKVLLSLGSTSIISILSYLSWNPFSAIVWLSVVSMVLIILLVIIIKFASMFVKNRVYLSSIYFSVVWALVPLVLLIPVGIILYRALSMDTVNLYVYLGLVFFGVWIFYRLMKGIYVIFDINPGRVYFYSIMIVLVLVCTFVLYFEIKNSFIDYLLLTFKQYNISDLL